jgi:hypothetical protein
MIKNYEITISPNYVSNWGINEAIREILQNAIDADKNGYKKSIYYSGDTLYINNEGISLSAKDLILGCSSKSDQDGMIGKYGEGFKLALVVLLRKGMNVYVDNNDKLWSPSFKVSEQFGTQVLNIEESDDGRGEGLTFVISPVDQQLYNSLLNYFPCIDESFGNVVNCDNGQILLDKQFKGKMYVEGLYIQTDDNFQYGYNFNSDVVELDRDRKAINYYELRALTAQSIVTAEECNKEIFDAITKSCVDVRDIEEVIDEASESFLEEYREQFYEENELEENTLVATESVMKQLEQMDIDVPVVKGTEIQSYLIAKANDKLGIIEEAKEAIKNKDEKEEAFDDFKNSKYARLMNWFYTNKHYLPKKAQMPFLDIMKSMTPYEFYKISDSIPEEFDYSDENIKALKEEILKKEEILDEEEM